jgi:4-amino-4-deoxy-L-arabinose transferase-like glycosyltransferase
MLYLFYFSCAGAFLSKGLAGLFHIAVVIVVFILLSRRREILTELIMSPAIILFVIPVGLWIYFYYQEGGMAYLHELFINNTIGCFFRIHFSFNERIFYNTDLGNKEPWYFYLRKMPRMFGPVLLIIPFAVWQTIIHIRQIKSAQSAGLKQFEHFHLPVSFRSDTERAV